MIPLRSSGNTDASKSRLGTDRSSHWDAKVDRRNGAKIPTTKEKTNGKSHLQRCRVRLKRVQR
jgi:hypothetical protein